MMAELPDALEPIGAVQRTRVGREATEPMREDIRLLGGILGDTVREQNGDEVFDLVERARVESFRVRRSEIDRAELARMFDGIDIHEAISVIRAFSDFALLANVAEDIHRERRRAIHVQAGEPPQNSSLAATYLKLDAAQLDSATVAHALEDALVSPVITAHPTETRRRTVFDTQHRITELMRLRLHGQTETPDGRDIETELRRQILTLWQTALIRLQRLKIQDEIEVGLRYYHSAFFEVMPQVNAEVRHALRARWPDAHLLEHAILRPGSWIGGDRDGNPNVTADVVRLATGRAAHTAFGHYFAELTALEEELSMSARLVTVTDDLSRAGRPVPRTGYGSTSRIGVRCASSAGGSPRPRSDILDRQPLLELDLGLRAVRNARTNCSPTSTSSTRSLRSHGGDLLADDRLARLRESVRVFGFHLCGLDMRQNSDVHEEVIAELLAWAGVHPDYTSLSEPERVELLAADLATRRPLTREHTRLSELAQKELDIVAAAARAVQRVRPRSGPHLHRLDVPLGVRHARGRGPAQRGRAARRVGRTQLPGGHRAAVRDDRRPAARRIDSRSGAGPSGVPAAGQRARRQPGGDARLLGLQQGRRVPRRELGAVPRRTRPGRDRAQGRYSVAALPRSRRHRRPRGRTELRRDPRAAARRRVGLVAAHRAG